MLKLARLRPVLAVGELQRPVVLAGGLESHDGARRPVVGVVHLVGNEARNALDPPLATETAGRGRTDRAVGPVSAVEAEEVDLTAEADGIGVGGRVEAIAAAVVDEAVPAVPHAGGPDREDVLENRHLEGALGLGLFEAAEGGPGVAAEGSRRTSRDDRDRTGRSVAAEKHALRPTEDVHVLDVEELRELTDGRVEVDVVVEDGDGARGVGVEVAEADATNEERRIRVRVGRANLEVRRELRDVGDRLGTERLEVLLVEGRDRHGGVLQGRLLARRGHDELFDSRRARLGRLGAVGAALFRVLGEGRDRQAEHEGERASGKAPEPDPEDGKRGRRDAHSIT